MPDFSSEVSHFIVELDAAVEAHMGWTHRVMRCAVLHTSPGEDVLAPQAHTLCRFGHWFVTQRARFEKADAQNARRIEDVHRTMHDAISHICVDILAGRPGHFSVLFAIGAVSRVGGLADAKNFSTRLAKRAVGFSGSVDGL